MLAFALGIPESGERQGWGMLWGVGPAGPSRSSLLLRAGSIIIQCKMSGSREMFRQCLGLSEMLMCSMGHPLTWRMFNEHLLCTRPTLQRDIWDTDCPQRACISRHEGTWNGFSGRMISEQVHEVQRLSKQRK